MTARCWRQPWYHLEHYVEHHPGELRDPPLSIRDDVPPETLRILAQSWAPLVRQAVVAAKQVPEDIVGRLCDDSDRNVRMGALGHTQDERCLREGATLPDSFLRKAVARNPATPVDVLEQLVADPDPGPREGVVHNERALTVWIDRLASRDPSPPVRWSALKKSRSPEIVAAAVRSPEKEVRAGAASNPLLTDAEIRTLGSDPESFVRYTLARFGRLPADLQVRLLHDPDQTVRLMLAMNERLPRELLVQLLHDGSNVVRESARVAWHLRGLDRPGSDHERAADDSGEAVWRGRVSRLLQRLRR